MSFNFSANDAAKKCHALVLKVDGKTQKETHRFGHFMNRNNKMACAFREHVFLVSCIATKHAIILDHVAAMLPDDHPARQLLQMVKDEAAPLILAPSRKSV